MVLLQRKSDLIPGSEQGIECQITFRKFCLRAKEFEKQEVNLQLKILSKKGRPNVDMRWHASV